MFEFLRRRKRRFDVDSATFSDRGLVRPDNQDHVLAYGARGLYCIADGMGGGEGGAKASEIACASISRAVSRRTDFAERVKRTDEALRSANVEIRDYAAKAGYRQMATTAAVLLLDLAEGRQGVVGSVGDSRVYRFRGGELVQLTRDHTMACELSRTIGGRAMSAGISGREHLLSHVLTRAIGIEPEVKPEWRRIDFAAGDAFLVCSDGLYDMADAAAIRAAVAAGGRAKDVVARLAETVVKNGASDNYSMIVVKVGAHA